MKDTKLSKLIFLFPLFMLICVTAFAQEVNKAVLPLDRNIERFQSEVNWINAIARNQTDFPIDLIFVGDSITHGWEGAGKAVWDQYYGNRRAFNFGISGDQTGHVIWRIENAPMNKIAPKMAVVMIGTNNGDAPADTAKGIEKIVSMLQERYPAIRILLLEVFPREEKPDAPRRIRNQEINEILRRDYSEAENVTLMDLSGLFLDENGNIPKDLMPDFLHPNAEGYKRWAEAIEPEIEKTLGPIPADPPEAVGYPRELERFQQKNELLQQGNVDVLMIGDSITHYWENNGQEAWAELFKNHPAINLGTGWDRTENVIWRLEHYDFSKVNPKLAFLLIGVNNSGSSEPINIGKGNRKICQILHKKFPAMKVYVQKVFPWGQKDLNGNNELRKRINEAIEKEVADLDYVHLLDLSDCFLTPDGKLNTEVMTPDLVHLEKAGYENWKNAIQPYVDQQ